MTRPIISFVAQAAGNNVITCVVDGARAWSKVATGHDGMMDDGVFSRDWLSGSLEHCAVEQWAGQQWPLPLFIYNFGSRNFHHHRIQSLGLTLTALLPSDRGLWGITNEENKISFYERGSSDKLILTKSIDDKNIFCLVQTLNEITTKPTTKDTQISVVPSENLFAGVWRHLA